MSLPVRYLQVNITLTDNDHQNQMFEQYMRQLLPTFEDKPWPGWELFLSASRTPANTPSSDKDEKDYQHYLHIWRVKDYNTLPYIMEEFDDDETYRSLDNMVLREVQDFAQALVYNPQSHDPEFDPADGARYYMHTTMDVVADAEALDGLRTFMTGCADDPNSPMRKEYHWDLVQGSYSQTGLLRRYFHIWRTSSESAAMDPQAAIDWLKKQDAIQNVLNPRVEVNPQWQIWKPVDYLKG